MKRKIFSVFYTISLILVCLEKIPLFFSSLFSMESPQMFPESNPSQGPALSAPQLLSSIRSPKRLSLPQMDSTLEQWDLEKAVQRALDANPDVTAARKAIEEQQGVKMEFKAKLYPRGGLVYNFQREQSSLLMFLPTVPVYPLTRTSWFGAIQIRQTLLNLSAVKEARQQKELLERAIWSSMDVALKTVAKTKQAFYLTLYRSEVVRIREELLEVSRLIMQSSRRLAESGEIPNYQALTAESEYRTAQADLFQARSQMIQAQEQLRMLLNLPSTSEKDPLPLKEELELLPFDVPFEEALKIALEKRTDLNAARYALRAADASVAAAKASYYPNVDLLLQYETINDIYVLYPKFGWTAGAQGQWGLFNIMENEGKIRQKQAQKNIAEIRLQQLQMDIPAQLRQYYAQFKKAKEAVASQELSVKAAEQGLNQAVNLFKSGESGWVQAVTARQALLKARLGFLEALYNYNTALADLEYAVGGQFPPGYHAPPSP